jgi:hypothetical protein
LATHISAGIALTTNRRKRFPRMPSIVFEL